MNSFVISRPALLTALDVDHVPNHRSMVTRCKWVKKWIMKKYDIEDWQINRGFCFIFAYVVAALTPHDVAFYTDQGHVAVYDPQTKKLHDSDHVEGTEDFEEIDCRGWGCDPHIVSRTAMELLWASIGRQSQEFRQLIRKFEPGFHSENCHMFGTLQHIDDVTRYIKKELGEEYLVTA